ncbi:MAG: diphosphomevalonate/mevalonate 3,5-bisphosphate decarboxylase family protein [Saprospiraceae bacterium]
MLDYVNPRLILDSSNPPESGQIVWRSPSNIAIVKYWGKYDVQRPQNPSISLTLSSSVTDMALAYAWKDAPADDISLDFLFHEEPNEAFAEKIRAYLRSLDSIFPFLRQLALRIRSGNSFPHSAGIASSASAMSALALCLCTLEDKLFGTLSDQSDFERKSSYLARLASGSACRSIFGYAALWGKLDSVQGSSDEYALGLGDQLHETFKDFHDDILIVSAEEKAVSSRAGHALMEGNPYAAARYAQARARALSLVDILRVGDLAAFGQIAEDEALALHALMMCSNPSYTLMRPNSLAIIERVRAFRRDTGHPVYFTLDAGPNVHLLYPGEIVHVVREWIARDLAEFCEEGYVQQDWVGEGPEEM